MQASKNYRVLPGNLRVQKKRKVSGSGVVKAMRRLILAEFPLNKRWSPKEHYHHIRELVAVESSHIFYVGVLFLARAGH